MNWKMISTEFSWEKCFKVTPEQIARLKSKFKIILDLSDLKLLKKSGKSYFIIWKMTKGS